MRIFRGVSFILIGLNVVFIACILSRLPGIFNTQKKLQFQIKAFQEKYSESRQGESSEFIRLDDTLKNASLISFVKNPAVIEDESKLKLAGICLGSNPLAFIKNLAADQCGIFRVGDRVWGYDLSEILPNCVLLKKTGRLLTLNIDASSSESECFFVLGNNEILIRKDKLAPVMFGLLEEINFSQLSPRINPEKARVEGLKISGVAESGILNKLGFEPGDIISGINGHEVYSIPRALLVANVIKNEKFFVVDIIRGGLPVTLKLHIN